MDGAREIDLLRRQVASGFSASCWPRIRIELSGVRSSWDILARNSDLYFEVRASSFAFSSSARARLLDFLVLALDLDVALGELLRLLFELLVRLLQFALARLQLDGELLRLLQQRFRLHRRFDRVQHDADRGRELLEEGDCSSVKAPSEASSNTAFTWPSNSTGSTIDVLGHRPEQARGDRQRPCPACR